MNLPAASLLSARFGFALLLVLTSCAGPVYKNGELPKLMVERLEWMDDVAKVKQAKSLPITDPKREAELLAAMEQQGIQRGLPPQAVRAFFKGQIEAAKVFQNEWLAANRQGSEVENQTAKPLPDLAGSVRPALDEIGQKMLAGLVRARRDEKSADVILAAREALKKADYSKPVIEAAVGGLEIALR